MDEKIKLDVPILSELNSIISLLEIQNEVLGQISNKLSKGIVIKK
jgi:hypothetical protein